MSFVDFFPPELTEVVFSHLSVPDLVNSSLVCVSWYEASNRSSIWREAIERSTPKDRFKKLSDLDRFTGIASNYDENHCFQVDRQSPCNLSPMNPWKLSMCQNNFLQSNWRGKHNTIFARHQIKFEDGMKILNDLYVVYPSRSPQDCLYLPILAKKIGQRVKDFFLIRLDGKPRISRKILSTKKLIPIVCIDRVCVVWVQGTEVKYLSLVDNDNSEIEDLGILISESIDRHHIDFTSCMMTMNDKYIVAGFSETFVKIWCRKTKQLKLTHETADTISNVKCVIVGCELYNERIIFQLREPFNPDIEDEILQCFLKIYDIKDKFLVNPFSIPHVTLSAFNDKYYVVCKDIISSDGNLDSGSECITVHDIETDEIKIRVNLKVNSYFTACIDDDRVFYIDSIELKILSLVDQNISNRISVSDIGNSFNTFYVQDSLLLVEHGNSVSIWDWKHEKKLWELLMDETYPAYKYIGDFYHDDIRLLSVSEECVNIIGFW